MAEPPRIDSGPADSWRAALRHGMVAGTVVALHLALLLFLLRPPAPLTPARPAASAGTGHALQIRLLGADTLAAVPPPAPPHPPTAPLPAALPVQPQPPSPQPHPRSSRRLDLQLHTRRPAARPAAGPDYIPGGRGFADALRATRHRPRSHLPGSDDVPGVSPFPMHDPDGRSVDSLVHHVTRILFGAADPECLKLDHWGTLSRRDLAAEGLTPDELAEQKTLSHCPTAHAHPLKPDGVP